MKRMFAAIIALLLCTFSYSQSSKTYLLKDGLPNLWITSITQGAADDIWVGTRKGLVRLNGSSVLNLDKKNGLPGNLITCLFYDSKGNLWVGTSRGASKYDMQNWQNYSLKDGLPNQYVTSINEDPEGNIYIATKTGIAVLDGTNISVLTTSNGLPKSCIHDIEFKDETIWYSAFEGTAGFYDGANWTYFEQGKGYFNPNVYSGVFCGFTVATLFSPGGMLLGIVVGLPLGYAVPYKGNYTRLAYDLEGNIWMTAFGGGVFRYDGANWTSFGKNTGLPKTKIATDVACGEDGTVWIGINGGLLSYANESWEVKTKKNSDLPHKLVTAVFPDSYGNVWVGTRKGLLKIYSESETNIQ